MQAKGTGQKKSLGRHQSLKIYGMLSGPLESFVHISSVSVRGIVTRQMMSSEKS